MDAPSGPAGTIAYVLPLDPQGQDPAAINRMLQQVESHATRLRACVLLHYAADHFPSGAQLLALEARRDDVHDDPFFLIRASAFAVGPAGEKQDLHLSPQWAIDLRLACLGASTRALENLLIGTCKGQSLTPQGLRDLACGLWTQQERATGLADAMGTQLPPSQGVPRPRM